MEKLEQGYRPCAAGHMVWLRGPLLGDKIPAGTPCECGLTRVTYEKCRECGHERVVFLPVAVQAPA